MIPQNSKRSRTACKNGILTRHGQRAKGRIVAAGLKLGEVARAAGMHESSFSNYLAGRRRDARGQLRIVEAFARLTGQRLRARVFWGDLAAKEVA